MLKFWHLGIVSFSFLIFLQVYRKLENPEDFFLKPASALTIEGVAGGGGAKILWAYFSPNQACFLQPPVVEDVSSPIFSIHFTEGSSHDISISDLLAC